MTHLATELRAALKSALPSSWRVGGFTTPGRVDRPTVAAWTTDLTHLDGAPNGNYVVTYTVAIYSQHQDGEKADNALDGHLQKVIDALWGIENLVLDRAERTVTNEQTVHAWVLTVRTGITITQED